MKRIYDARKRLKIGQGAAGAKVTAFNGAVEPQMAFYSLSFLREIQTIILNFRGKTSLFRLYLRRNHLSSWGDGAILS